MKHENNLGLNKAIKRASLHLTPALPKNLKHEAYGEALGPLSDAGDSLHEVLRQMHRADRPDIVAKLEQVSKDLDAMAIEFGVRGK
jgi:hypothetical protein